MHVDAGLGEAEGGDGAPVTGADDQDRDVRPAVDRGGGGARGDGGAGGRGGGASGDGHRPDYGTCSSDEPSSGEALGALVGHERITHATFLTVGWNENEFYCGMHVKSLATTW
ncbi:hypothetical protein GCM10020254_13070 [Streptomyces goshikiensis]